MEPGLRVVRGVSRRRSRPLTIHESELLLEHAREKWPGGWVPEGRKSTCRVCGEWIYWMTHVYGRKYVPVDLDGTNHLARHAA